MKKVSFLFILLTCLVIAQAQVTINDSVSLGAGYVKMSYYSLANGEVANENAKDWDLQFWNNIMSSSIRVNDGAGVILYQLHHGDDTASWNSVDTAMMTPLYNADTSWEAGAFGALAGTHPDYGWGTYTGGGNLTGYRIFVLKTINGNYKKIWIKRLAYDGTNAFYEIAIGNLDNTSEELVTITKTNYPTKDFIYYAIDSAEVKDVDPAQTDWDFVARRYYSSSEFYVVTGVLTNPEVTVAEARGVDISSNDYSGYSFEENISVIGSDWKTINMTVNPPVYDIADSLAYFVAAQDGNIYKVIFSKFLYTPFGEVFFSKTQLPPPATAVSEISNLESLTTYPNPATDRIQTLFTLKENADVTVRIFDLAGKTHQQFNTQARAGLNNFSLNVAALSQGFYLLCVDDGNNKLTYKFAKN